MRTPPPSVQHLVSKETPVKNPSASRLQNNSILPKGKLGPNCAKDFAFRFSNIMRFGMQRFCICMNLACQILSFLHLKQFSLTINNCYAIKTC